MATLFAVFKMAEICERSERATENKKSVSEEILNFLDVGSTWLLQLLLFPEERRTSSTLSSMDSDSGFCKNKMGIPTTDVPSPLLDVKHGSPSTRTTT